MLRILIAVSILSLLVALPRSESASVIKRLTSTPEHTLNLNPSLSDDGRTVVFESSSDLFWDDGEPAFHAIRADVPSASMMKIARGRMVSPTLSSDARVLAFASTEDLVGNDPVVDEDFNSEIYVASLAPRAAFGAGTVLNAAALGNEPDKETRIAPGSIASFRGESLGSTVTVNGQAAQVYYASSTEVIFVVPENAGVGSGEIVVTNADGFSSKAQVIISSAAPGVFTVSGDGKGEGIILDSDLITPGPFDPSNGQRRLSIFATGVRHAKSVSVKFGGQPTIVETVARADLPGLDEVHVLLPVSLSGTGITTLSIDADGFTSNPVSVVLAGMPPVSQDKVAISQIFGGGGNSGAPFRNDFIEIFNAGSTPMNLAGWSVQYASATASTWSSTPLTSIVLAPGQHYLIQQAAGNNGAALPTPDTIGTIAMAAGAGKVALVKNTTPLTGACPSDSNIVDLVGYGSTANCFRGTGTAPGASNTNAATRTANGCTDTRNNATDFALAPANPRNTQTQINPCLINIQSVLLSTCSTSSETLRLAHALARRRDHNFAPALRLRRFP
jgi:uncharacterized protein (TIGR03437 family)